MFPRESRPTSQWLLVVLEANINAAFHVAYRVTWNRADAQDVVQEAFIKALLRVDQLREPVRARSWLLSITYREALMNIRARRDVPTDPAGFEALPGRLGDPADAVLVSELASEINTAIGRLPELLRMAFVLRDVEELPIAQVADILGVSISASKMRVSRAREQLRIDLRDATR